MQMKSFYTNRAEWEDKLKDAYGAIYEWHCTVSSKSYVGKVLVHRLEERAKEHYNRRDKCKALNCAIKKYGANSFIVTIIDVAYSEKSLNEKEIFWIKEKGCISPNGYNIKSGGEGGRQHKTTRKAISDALKGKPLSEEHKMALRAAKKPPILALCLDTYNVQIGYEKMLSRVNGWDNAHVNAHVIRWEMSSCLLIAKSWVAVQLPNADVDMDTAIQLIHEKLMKLFSDKISTKSKANRYALSVVFKYEKDKLEYLWNEKLFEPMNQLKTREFFKKELGICLNEGGMCEVFKGKRSNHKGYFFRYLTTDELEEYVTVLLNKARQNIEKELMRYA